MLSPALASSVIPSAACVALNEVVAPNLRALFSRVSKSFPVALAAAPTSDICFSNAKPRVTALLIANPASATAAPLIPALNNCIPLKPACPANSEILANLPPL